MSVVSATRPASTDEIAAEMDRRGAVIAQLEVALAAQIEGHCESARQSTENLLRANAVEKQRDEALAYLKSFVYATIDPEDRRADVQVHQANPSLGWVFTLNDTAMRGQREILGSQIRRAMEIVGFDRLKIDPAGTAVADDHVAAIKRALELQARVDKLLDTNAALLAATKALADRNLSYAGCDILITCESHGDAIRQMRVLRDAIAKAEGRP